MLFKWKLLRYIPMVMFIVQWKVALTFQLADEILKYDHSIYMEATAQYFPVYYAVRCSGSNVRVCSLQYSSTLLFIYLTFSCCHKKVLKGFKVPFIYQIVQSSTHLNKPRSIELWDCLVWESAFVLKIFLLRKMISTDWQIFLKFSTQTITFSPQTEVN